MELLPLLIFLGGIIYSAIASQKNKGRKEQRNIDPGKLNNPAKRSSRPGSSGRQGSSRGFFEQVKGELERSFGAFDESSDSQQKQAQTKNMERQERSRPERRSSARPERTRTERPMSNRSFGRSLEEKARESRTGGKAMDYYEDKVSTDRSKHRERAQKAKESVYTGGLDRSEAEKRVKGIGRESAELARYSLDEEDLFDESTDRSRDQKTQREPALGKDDLSFDRKAVVNGIIFSEILGKPKSRR